MHVLDRARLGDDELQRADLLRRHVGRRLIGQVRADQHRRCHPRVTAGEHLRGCRRNRRRGRGCQDAALTLADRHVDAAPPRRTDGRRRGRARGRNHGRHGGGRRGGRRGGPRCRPYGWRHGSRLRRSGAPGHGGGARHRQVLFDRGALSGRGCRPIAEPRPRQIGHAHEHHGRHRRGSDETPGALRQRRLRGERWLLENGRRRERRTSGDLGRGPGRLPCPLGERLEGVDPARLLEGGFGPAGERGEDCLAARTLVERQAGHQRDQGVLAGRPAAIVARVGAGEPPELGGARRRVEQLPKHTRQGCGGGTGQAGRPRDTEIARRQHRHGGRRRADVRARVDHHAGEGGDHSDGFMPVEGDGGRTQVVQRDHVGWPARGAGVRNWAGASECTTAR
jgi:hypothetical protein